MAFGCRLGLDVYIVISVYIVSSIQYYAVLYTYVVVLVGYIFRGGPIQFIYLGEALRLSYQFDGTFRQGNFIYLLEPVH